jgi:hypothetical protein
LQLFGFFENGLSVQRIFGLKISVKIQIQFFFKINLPSSPEIWSRELNPNFSSYEVFPALAVETMLWYLDYYQKSMWHTH